MEARRVAVVGASGSGKSKLARMLAGRLSLPYVELDALHHGPQWAEPTAEEFRAVVTPLVERGGWVVDGNYEGKLGDLVLERADTVVWLDLSLPVILRRLWRRTARRIRTGEELWNGNRESWRGAFCGRESLFVWAIRRHRALRRELPSRLRRPTLRHLSLIHLRSPSEVNRWLERVSSRTRRSAA